MKTIYIPTIVLPARKIANCYECPLSLDEYQDIICGFPTIREITCTLDGIPENCPAQDLPNDQPFVWDYRTKEQQQVS